jgi:hypothetical protein
MNSNDRKKLNEFNQITIDFQNKVVNNCSWNCCLNCTNYDGKSEICNLYKQRPPITVSVFGCVEHFPKRINV